MQLPSSNNSKKSIFYLLLLKLNKKFPCCNFSKKKIGRGGISIRSIHLVRISENFILENSEKQIALCEMAAREVSFKLFVTPQDFILQSQKFLLDSIINSGFGRRPFNNNNC